MGHSCVYCLLMVLKLAADWYGITYEKQHGEEDKTSGTLLLDTVDIKRLVAWQW